MNADTLVCLLIFLEYALLFLDDSVDEKCEKLSNSKNPASRCCLAFA